MKERIIPIKNYLILAIIFVSTIGVTLYLSSWYKAIEKYNKSNSVVSEVIKEIESETLPSYLLDNPEIVLYVSSSTDESIKSFEKQFKKMIIEEDLNDKILFLDLNKEENINSLTFIRENYFPANLKRIENIDIPNLIYFSEGQVQDILYIKNTDINKSDVKKFLERIELIEND